VPCILESRCLAYEHIKTCQNRPILTGVHISRTGTSTETKLFLGWKCSVLLWLYRPAWDPRIERREHEFPPENWKCPRDSEMWLEKSSKVPGYIVFHRLPYSWHVLYSQYGALHVYFLWRVSGAVLFFFGAPFPRAFSAAMYSNRSSSSSWSTSSCNGANSFCKSRTVYSLGG